MSEDTVLKIRLPGESPWIQGPIVDVLKSNATKIADIVSNVAENLRAKKLQSSWAYDKYVFASIREHLPEESAESHALLIAAQKILSERMNREDWYDGSYAAYRCISTHNAYATPGFAEARRNSAIFSS
jgi:hypothetical protein